MGIMMMRRTQRARCGVGTVSLCLGRIRARIKPASPPEPDERTGFTFIIGTPLIQVIPILLGVASAVDAASAHPHPAAPVAALGLGLGTGCLAALALALVFRAVFARSFTLIVAIWLMPGAAFAVWLIERLAAVERLHSEYWPQAIIVMSVSVVSGAALSLIGVAVQPRRSHPRGWLFEQGLRFRTAAIGVSSLLAVFLLWIDRSQFLTTYPIAVFAIRWVSLLSAAIAIAVVASSFFRTIARWGRRALIVACVPVLAAILTTDALRAGEWMTRPYSALALTTLRWFLDVDRDGHSALLAGGDCDDLDARVNPMAREIPGNGIDDNCMLGDASARPELPAVDTVPVPGAPSPVSVVYISVDAVSAAHMGIYGYERNTTPNFDKWARRNGVVFENAQAVGATTVIAFSSMFRGVYARRLHWNRMVRTWAEQLVPAEKGEPLRLTPGDTVRQTYQLPAREPRPTLPEQLKRRGTKTLGVTAMHFANPASGVVGKFEELVSLVERSSRDPDDEGATRQVLAWLRRLTRNDRYFLWIHYLGPHTPTTRHEGAPDFGQSVKDGYDHEIATFDRRLAPLLAELDRRRSSSEPLVVIFSADHGEDIGRDRYHAHSLSEAVTRIPLVVSLPGVAPRRVSDVVSAVDLVPTVLCLCKAPLPAGLDGVDLSDLARGRAHPRKRVVLTDAWVDLAGEFVTDKVAATDGEYRLILDLTNQFAYQERSGASAAGRNPPRAADVAHLRQAIDSYLEETGALPY